MSDLKSIRCWQNGKSIEQDLIKICIEKITDLIGKEDEELYSKSCLFKGFKEDRCLLYVFRLVCILPKTKTEKKKNSNGGTGNIKNTRENKIFSLF